MEYLTSEEAAAVLRIPEPLIRKLCRRGDVPGALKAGKGWRIPADFAERMAVTR